MKIEVRNPANIPNKYIRFIKWKIRKIQRKFNGLLYTEVFINKEGNRPPIYKATIRLGIPGDDLILNHTSSNLPELWKQSLSATQRILRKKKEKQLRLRTNAKI